MGQEFLNVFTDDVNFNIDNTTRGKQTQSGNQHGMGNNRYREALVVHRIDGQADAVNGDGAFLDDITPLAVWHGKGKYGKVAMIDLAKQFTDPVDMATDQMASQTVAKPERPLQIDTAPHRESAEIGL